MPAFKVMISAENILIRMDSEEFKAGFYTTRFVTAESMEAAGNLALTDVMNLPRLRAVVLNVPNDPPHFMVEKIEEIDEPSSPNENPMGLAFFRMEYH